MVFCGSDFSVDYSTQLPVFYCILYTTNHEEQLPLNTTKTMTQCLWELDSLGAHARVAGAAEREPEGGGRGHGHVRRRSGPVRPGFTVSGARALTLSIDNTFVSLILLLCMHVVTIMQQCQRDQTTSGSTKGQGSLARGRRPTSVQ